MIFKVAIIIGGEWDLPIFNESLKVLNEYEVPFELKTVPTKKLNKGLPEYAKDAYKRGIRLVIAGTRGDADFSNAVASCFSIPTIGVPCRSETAPNTVESVFSVLQQPNEHAVATVALNSGQNAGILAVQILALSNETLQKKVIAFKENLKNKILKANEELVKIKFEYKTN